MSRYTWHTSETKDGPWVEAMGEHGKTLSLPPEIAWHYTRRTERPPWWSPRRYHTEWQWPFRRIKADSESPEQAA